MTTILRVKRKCTDSPLDSLVLCLKKRRLDSADSVDSSSNFLSTEVVQLVGTVRDLKGDANKYVTKLISSNIKATENTRGIKRTSDGDTSLSKKIPKVTKPLNVINYQVVDIDNQENSDDQWATLVDVDTSENKNIIDGGAQNQEEEEDMDYIYDLYYTRTNIFIEESNIEVHKIVSKLSTYDDNWEDKNYPSDEESIQSDNADSESHAKTLYPDTDSEDDDSYKVCCSDEDSDRQQRDELFESDDIMEYRDIMHYYTDEEDEIHAKDDDDDNDSDSSFGIL